MAVMDIIKNMKELYPGTNMIANIRVNVAELENRDRQDNTLKLEAETEKERIERWQKESVPMPAECKLALSKLGIKIGE